MENPEAFAAAVPTPTESAAPAAAAEESKAEEKAEEKEESDDDMVSQFDHAPYARLRDCPGLRSLRLITTRMSLTVPAVHYM